MTVKRVSPEEAQELMRGEGYVYLDVRSVPEFDAGHPAGAYNVPLIHMGPAGSQPNPDFLAVMEKRFPKDAQARRGLQDRRPLGAGRGAPGAGGLHELRIQQAGFVGSSPVEPGWGPKGLPHERDAEPGATPGTSSRATASERAAGRRSSPVARARSAAPW